VALGIWAGTAAGASEEVLQLPDLLHQAESQAPALKAADAHWLAEQQKAAQAGAWPEPKLTYAHFVESVETRVGPQEQRFGLSQQIPWFGLPGLKRVRAEAMASAKGAGREGVRQELLRETKHLFYDLHFAQEALRLTQQKLGLMDQLEQISQTRYQVGTSSQRTLLAIQLEAERLKERALSLEDRIETSRIRLAAVLDFPTDALANKTAAFPQVDYAEVGLQITALAASDAISSHPDLSRLEAHLLGAEAAARLAGKKSYPGLGVGLQYIQTGEALNPQLADSGKDPWLVTLSLNLPLWFGANRAAREEVRFRQQALGHETMDRRNRLQAEFQVAARALAESERQVALHQDRLIPLASQGLDVALRDFAGGGVSYLEVLAAEQDLLGLELGLARARADRGRHLASIEWIVGRALDRAHAPAGQ